MAITVPVEQAAPEVEQIEPAARVPAQRLFKYSEFVDVGSGAEQCEHARDGNCSDTEHFHAWCRLPNPYQHQDIRAKGMAAKARHVRALRDPESDASVVLDGELSAIDDPVYVGTIIDELVTRDWAENYLEAQRDVEEREQFEHIAQDREEYGRLSAQEGSLPEAEQSEEFRRLVAHMQSYVDAMQARLKEIEAPLRAEMQQRSLPEIVALVRTKRVEETSDRAFEEAYNAWMWFVGTFHVDLHETRRRPHRPMWDDIGHRDRPAAGTMYGESPEVIEALRTTYNDLQIALQRGSAGN